MELLIRALLAGAVIATASWLSGRSPTLAGFLVAIPISTAIVLPMSFLEHGSFANTMALARSIALAVPLTLTFFLPFFFADKWGLGFWSAYVLAFACLAAGFALHRWVATSLWGG